MGANMTTFMNIAITCPNCHEEFTGEILTSTNTLGGQTTDFRSLAAGFQPEVAMMQTCPRCGFTAFEEEFKGAISAELSTMIAERITPYAANEKAEPWRRFEYAAWIAEWRDRPELEVAHLFLLAGWVCADATVHAAASLDDLSEEFYRRQAIEHFEKALEKGHVPTVQRANIAYLIGEQYRRTNDSPAAEAWYDQAIQWVQDGSRDEGILDLAEQQKTSPRERL